MNNRRPPTIRKFYTLPFFSFTATEGFAFRDYSNDELFRELDCTGDDLASAKDILPANFTSAIPISLENAIVRVVVYARYIDVSNFAVRVPSFVGSQFEIEVYASAASFPSAGAVEVFLPSGQSFADGSGSVSVPAGTGVKLRVVALNGSTPVWARLGQ